MLAEVEIVGYLVESRGEAWGWRSGRPSAQPRWLTRAVEDPGEEAEQWERLRRRLARLPARRGATATQLIQAYEEATGTCLGCD
jgi:hypothetical protein